MTRHPTPPPPGWLERQLRRLGERARAAPVDPGLALRVEQAARRRSSDTPEKARLLPRWAAAAAVVALAIGSGSSARGPHRAAAIPAPPPPPPPARAEPAAQHPAIPGGAEPAPAGASTPEEKPHHPR